MAGLVATGLVDCDIHNQPASDARLRPYLPERWRRHIERFGTRARHGLAQGFPYPKATPLAARIDAWPPGGGPPGSSLDFMRRQLLDPLGVSVGVLNCLHAGATQVDPELGAALCSAVNDWQAEEWLEPEPRLRASIVMPFDDGELAAAEIDRVAALHHSRVGAAARGARFVQALMLVRTLEPIGRRRYWPIFEACERHGLPLGIHFGGYSGHPISSSGWPSYYLEDHTAMAMAFQSQMVSLVFEGVFERFPGLRVVCIEGGVAWLPPLAWRMDRLFEELWDEVPELTRRPSEYLREHVWLTTQPVEEPERPEDLMQVFERVGRDRLLFATDYPHWDYDDPARAFPVPLPPGIRERVYADNARALYGLAAS
jgi:predicted TIM-barrel fold metal-dependent hydrolase